MAWPKGVPRKPRETIEANEGAAPAAPFSIPTEEIQMTNETVAAPAAKSANVDVIVTRDYWDADGVRHLAAWDEATNEIEVDPATGKQRIKMIKHPGAVVSVPREVARKGIDAGYFKADI